MFKAAADVVAAVPGRVVDMGTSLVSDGINGVQEIFNVEVEVSKVFFSVVKRRKRR